MLHDLASFGGGNLSQKEQFSDIKLPLRKNQPIFPLSRSSLQILIISHENQVSQLLLAKVIIGKLSHFRGAIYTRSDTMKPKYRNSLNNVLPYILSSLE